MMFMTAKVNIKKIAIAVIAAVVAIWALSAIFGGKKAATPTAVPTLSGNDARVAFLKSFGWEVTTSPTESGQVRIPKASSEVFDRYNALQKSQGYDLGAYAGKNVMRYVYKVENFPGATEPVYATLLIYKNQIIGGDITDTAAKGMIQGLKKPTATTPEASSPAA